MVTPDATVFESETTTFNNFTETSTDLTEVTNVTIPFWTGDVRPVYTYEQTDELIHFEGTEDPEEFDNITEKTTLYPNPPPRKSGYHDSGQYHSF